MSIYLDNSATTKVCDQAVAAAVYAMQTCYGNPSSLHGMGLSAEKLLTNSRETVAHALNCKPAEIIFTSGATESNNIAILGAADAAKRRGNRIITTKTEHISVLRPLEYLAGKGYEVVYLSPNAEGNYDPADIISSIDSQTILVSLSSVNSETGAVIPIKEIATGIKNANKNTLIHIDACQSFCRLRSVLGPVDMISVSGHKIQAPKGVGALYVKKGVNLRPVLHGGDHENKLRPGTESVPLIAAFGKAAEYTSGIMAGQYDRYLSLNKYLRTNLPNDVVINSSIDAVPYIINISTTIKSEIMMHFLENHGIYVSSGSACSKGAKSHVLSAMGIPMARIDTALRISMGADTTQDDLDQLLSGLRQGMERLRR
ncbi:MAG: cysteine desulfurase [Oscillospiraceae bacterium]|nr:cysteine desulfurase [Oscillospiraceae bacterium]